MSIRHRRAAAIAGTAVLATVSVGLSAATFSQWSTPVSAENPAAFPGTGDVNKPDKTDGCPILDPYTNDLFIARESDQGDLDIWRAPWNGKSWGDPVNLGAPVNTADEEFCPSPSRGNRLFFVRAPKRSAPSDPLVGDIYLARVNGGSYGAPQRLPDTVNSPAQEWSPSYYEEPDGTPVLYFSSTRPGSGSQDIWFSRNWGPATPAQGLNTGSSDARPNVRHDGLEIVFDSNRGGANRIWTSYRASPADPWGAPVQPSQLNGTLGNGNPSIESRASMSWDSTVLVFGSTRAGTADVYVASRGRNER